MKKKVLSFVLAFALAITCFAGMPTGADAEIKGITEVEISATGGKVTVDVTMDATEYENEQAADLCMVLYDVDGGGELGDNFIGPDGEYDGTTQVPGFEQSSYSLHDYKWVWTAGDTNYTHTYDTALEDAKYYLFIHVDGGVATADCYSFTIEDGKVAKNPMSGPTVAVAAASTTTGGLNVTITATTTAADAAMVEKYKVEVVPSSTTEADLASDYSSKVVESWTTTDADVSDPINIPLDPANANYVANTEYKVVVTAIAKAEADKGDAKPVLSTAATASAIKLETPTAAGNPGMTTITLTPPTVSGVNAANYKVQYDYSNTSGFTATYKDWPADGKIINLEDETDYYVKMKLVPTTGVGDNWYSASDESAEVKITTIAQPTWSFEVKDAANSIALNENSTVTLTSKEYGAATTAETVATINNTGNQALKFNVSVVSVGGVDADAFDVAVASGSNAVAGGGQTTISVTPKSNLNVKDGNYKVSILVTAEPTLESVDGVEATEPTEQYFGISFEVTKKAVTVNVNTLTKEYGETYVPDVNDITLDGGSTLAAGEDLSDLRIELTSAGFAKDAPVNGGTAYDVTGTAGNTNYNVTINGTGKLTVEKATLEPNVTAGRIKKDETLADSTLKHTFKDVNGAPLEGTLAWDDAENGDTPENIKPDGETAYAWIFTPTDTNNYNSPVKGTAVVKIGSNAPIVLPEYIVTFDAGTHGTLEGEATQSVVNGESAVNIPTVVPNEGYTFVGWSVKADGSQMADPETYTIRSLTTFYAVYEKGGETVSEYTHKAYMIGDDLGNFRPDANITRAEIAVVLAKLAGINENVTYTSNFSDVEAGAWYANYVAYLEGLGILVGNDEGKFNPNVEITRGELASLAARIGGFEGDLSSYDITQIYPDVDPNHWAANDLLLAYAAGWVIGDENGNARPNDPITRAEVVQIVNGVFDRTVDANGLAEVTYKTFPDVAATHWAYYQIIEATNDHTYAIVDGKEIWKSEN